METMFCKEVKKEVDHFNMNVNVFEKCAKSEVVHVVFEAPSAHFSEFLAEFLYNLGVDKPLETSGQVGHPKEYYFWFKEPLLYLEGSFPFIFFADPDIVISPAYVKLAEDLHAL